MRLTTLLPWAATGLLCAAALAGCTVNIGSDGHMGDDHVGSTSMMEEESGGEERSTTEEAPATSANMSDLMFVQMMIPHHEQAVEMAELAPGAGASPDVQALAATIAAEQAPEIAQMKAMLDRWNVGQMMDHSGHQMAGMVSDEDMDRLRGATGPEFDRLFLELMIAHHEGAIDMAADPLANGQDPQLRTLLESIVATQTAEIQRMQGMLASL